MKMIISSRPRRLLAIALVCSAATMAMPMKAHAQPAPSGTAPSSADLETARALLKAGREARTAGDHKKSLEHFRAAHALVRTAVTGIEVVRACVALRRYVEARDMALQVVNIPVESDETSRSSEARAEASKVADEVKSKIASLKIVVLVDGDSAAAPVVAIDGEVVPAAALGLPRKVDPGEHRVTATLGKNVQSATVVLAEGGSDTTTLRIVVPKEQRASGADGSSGNALDVKPSEVSLSPLVPIGFSVAGVGVLVGAITGGLALSERGELQGECPNRECSGTDWASTLSRARAFGNVSTVSFIVGGVGLAVGITGLFFPRRAEAPRRTGLRVEPWVSVAGGGVRGSF
jgi:hypothetical protein